VRPWIVSRWNWNPAFGLPSTNNFRELCEYDIAPFLLRPGTMHKKELAPKNRAVNDHSPLTKRIIFREVRPVRGCLLCRRQ
jgi:hypothetical protein